MIASALWAIIYSLVRKQTQCHTIIFTHSSTPVKGGKKIITFAVYIKKCIMRHPLSFHGMPGAKLRFPFQGKISIQFSFFFLAFFF